MSQLNKKNNKNNCISGQEIPNRYDLNWQLCNVAFGRPGLVAGMAERNILYSIARFTIGFARSCVFLLRPSISKNASTLFFVSSKNQLSAMHDVACEVEGGGIVEMVDPFVDYANVYFPLHRAYFLALKGIKATLRDYHLNSEEHIEKSYKSRGDLLALAPALREAAITYLIKAKPNIVVVSNDLVLWTRAVISAAKHLGIKTIYLQHSCVPKIVPKLDTDVAFLDGWDAARKYSEVNSSASGDVYLTGGARHDPYVQLDYPVEQDSDRLRVGLCINMVDNLESVERIAKFLATKNDCLSITVRPHPRERRTKALKSIARSINAKWSDPASQSALQFIKDHDAVIAGDSSILLDAALGKRKAIAIAAMGVHSDYLGLISSGIVFLANTDQELIDLLFSKLAIEQVSLRNYYAPLGSRWEGRSNELISSAINELSSLDCINHANWSRCSTNGVYQIKG